jgi:hypothetical protein
MHLLPQIQASTEPDALHQALERTGRQSRPGSSKEQIRCVWNKVVPGVGVYPGMRKQCRNAHQLKVFVLRITRRTDRGTILEEAGDYGVVGTDAVFPEPVIWIQVVIDAVKAPPGLAEIHSGFAQ